MSRQFIASLSIALVAMIGIVALQGFTSAETAKVVPAFEMRDLQEQELRLTDEKFQDKQLLIAGFGTWQDVSIKQALELEQFHKANPGVEIIAFIIDDLPTARDFKAQYELTYPCYKTDSVSNLSSSLQRLFETKKGKNFTLNQLPFSILTDKNRGVKFSKIGLATAKTLASSK
ncbi:redoxin domain-containing protein [Planctomycetota bacterium]|nr:redoxin domain-containing protein [Planctomycetota bacterium]